MVAITVVLAAVVITLLTGTVNLGVAPTRRAISSLITLDDHQAEMLEKVMD